MSFIEPSEARTMILRYKGSLSTIVQGGFPETNLTLSEDFDAGEINKLIKQTNCKGFRVYLGMDSTLAIRAILVATDSAGNDIVEADALIVEKGRKCPPDCPPDSSINS